MPPKRTLTSRTSRTDNDSPSPCEVRGTVANGPTFQDLREQRQTATTTPSHGRSCKPPSSVTAVRSSAVEEQDLADHVDPLGDARERRPTIVPVPLRKTRHRPVTRAARTSRDELLLRCRRSISKLGRRSGSSRVVALDLLRSVGHDRCRRWAAMASSRAGNLSRRRRRLATASASARCSPRARAIPDADGIQQGVVNGSSACPACRSRRRNEDRRPLQSGEQHEEPEADPASVVLCPWVGKRLWSWLEPVHTDRALRQRGLDVGHELTAVRHGMVLGGTGS